MTEHSSSPEPITTIEEWPPAEAWARFKQVLPADQVAAMDVMFSLRTTVQQLDKMITQWLNNEALSPGRFQVVALLWSMGRPVAQREIVNILQVSRATVSGLVEGLLQDGYIYTEPSSKDKRQVLVSLSAQGEQIAYRLVQENTARLRQLMTAMTPQQMTELANVLRNLLTAGQNAHPIDTAPGGAPGKI